MPDGMAFAADWLACMKPLVSIVTPVYNGARFLPGYVAMLQAQTCQVWHAFIVDDESSDDSYRLASSLTCADSRFTVMPARRLPGARRGPAAARATALTVATSECIAFCDVDDVWHPAKLAHQLAFHRLHQLDLSVSSYGRFRDVDKPSIGEWRSPPLKLDYCTLLGGNVIPMLTVVINASLLPLRLPEGPHEDFLLWLDLFREWPGLRYGCLNEGLAFYRQSASSLSGQKWKMVLWASSVYRRHGLAGFRLLCALVRWCYFQLQSTVRAMRLDGHRPVPSCSMAQLCREPVRCFGPSSY